MWRGASALAVGTVLLASCGDTAPSSTPTTRQQLPATSAAPSSPTALPSRESTATTQGAQPAPAAAATTASRQTSILLLSRTAGFRHTSIEPATDAISGGLTALGITVVVDPDAVRVSTDGLADFDAIVMLSTTGDWLDDKQQAAMEQWAAAGGGIAGIHAATDAEPNWSFIDDVFGARFAGHPAVQPATVEIEDVTHPATAGLPVSWAVSDEWYNFVPNPRDQVHVLANVNETSYSGGTMGSDHPVEWSRDPSPVAGRVWYTAMGHPDELWSDPTFTTHVVAGVAWTAGVDVRRAAGFSSGAIVHEVADRLESVDLT